MKIVLEKIYNLSWFIKFLLIFLSCFLTSSLIVLFIEEGNCSVSGLEIIFIFVIALKEIKLAFLIIISWLISSFLLEKFIKKISCKNIKIIVLLAILVFFASSWITTFLFLYLESFFRN